MLAIFFDPCIFLRDPVNSDDSFELFFLFFKNVIFEIAPSLVHLRRRWLMCQSRNRYFEQSLLGVVYDTTVVFLVDNWFKLNKEESKPQTKLGKSIKDCA